MLSECSIGADVGQHKRIALSIVRIAGSRPDLVVAGFMVATAALSMWISNTATTVMMYAVALPVIQMSARPDGDETKQEKFGIALMLGVA